MAFHDCEELKWKELESALTNLSLTWVSIGDYMVVVSSKIDVTINEEPYLALQLWFNVKSGQIINRIWGRTSSFGNVVSVAQLTEACISHFKGRPCIGFPVPTEDENGQNYIISQTPITRKISQTCQKVLEPSTDPAMKSCSDCLKLGDSEVQPEQDLEADITEKLFKEGEPHFNMKEERKFEVNFKFSCITDDCSYRTNNYRDFKAHSQQLSHLSTLVNLSHGTLGEQNTSNESIEPTKKTHLQDNNCIISPLKDTYPILVTDNEIFKCKKCAFSGDLSKFEEHIKTVHNEIEDYKCLHCNFTASKNKHLMIHMKKDHKNKCPKCNFETIRRKQLLLHVKKEHDVLPPGQNCEACGKFCRSRRSFELHQASEHGKGPLQKKCEVCEKPIQCVYFVKHMLMSHGIRGRFDKQCYWCKETFSTVSLLPHAMKKHFYGKFLCERCTFCGNFARELVDHMNENHEEVSSTKCPICKNNHPMEHLEVHYENCIKESYQTDEMCASCGKKFKSRKALKKHSKFYCREEVEKEGGTSFCEKCGNKYADPRSLRDHIRSAHENFAFKCKLCSLTFSSKTKKDKHTIIAHSTDDRYKCRFCGLRKGNVNDVKKHERVHEDPKFQCRFCEKKLKSPTALEGHERNHTGEKPFECDVCSNGFVTLQSIQQHMRGVHKITGPRGGKVGWSTNKSKKKASGTVASSQVNSN